MNEIPKFAAPQSVTTGPIAGSRKVYASPEGRPDMSVPFREIALSDSNEAPVRVYDPSGPYTESAVRFDLDRGLPAVREGWIVGRGYSAIDGRAIRPEDNGDVSADRLAPLCPAKRTLRAGGAGQFVTQYEFARAGIITEEMIYVAHRENLAREGKSRRRAPGSPTARASGPRFPSSSRRSSCGARSRAGGRSFPPTSITSSSSRWRSAAISLSRSTPTSATRR